MVAQKKQNYKEKFKSFYNSAEWMRLRREKFADANGLCENCLKRGVIRAGVDVHHIVPIEKDWSKRLDYDNLMLLCKDCHNEIHDRGGSLSKFLEKFQF